MPRVPIPQIGLQGGSGASYSAQGTPSPRTYGAEEAQQLGAAQLQLGTGMMSLARVLQDEVDDARVKESYTQAAEHAMRALSTKDGYLSKIGKDAVGQSREDTLESIGKKAKEIEDSLDNEHQRARFRAGWGQHFVAIEERVYGHEAEQMRTWTVSRSKAMSIQAANDAIDSWFSRSATPTATATARAAKARATSQALGELGVMVPEQAIPGDPADLPTKDASFERNKSLAIQQAHEVANAMGFGSDDPQRQLLVQDATKQIHAGIVERLLDRGRGTEARAYYNAIPKGELDAESATKVESALKRSDLSTSASAIADDVTTVVENQITARMAKDLGRPAFRDDVFGGDAINLARNLITKARKDGKITPEEADMALDRVMHTFNSRRQAFSDQGAMALQKVEAMHQKFPTLTLHSPTFPPALFAQLVRYGRTDDADKILKQTKDRESDPKVYKQLFDDATSGVLATLSPSQFYTRYKPGLVGAEWSHAMSMYSAATSQETKPVNLDKDDLLGLAAATKLIEDVKSGPRDAEAALRMIYFGKEVERRLRGVKNPDWDTKLRVAQDVASEGNKVTVGDLWKNHYYRWELGKDRGDNPNAWVPEAWVLGSDHSDPDGRVYVNRDVSEGVNANAFIAEFKARGLPEPRPDFVHWIEQKVDPDVTRAVIKMLESKGEPVNETTFFRQWSAMKAAKTKEDQINKESQRRRDLMLSGYDRF